MNRSLLSLAALSLASLATAACSPSYDHLDFSPQTTPPLAFTLTSAQVDLPAGVAVAVSPVAMAGQDKLDGSIVGLTSTDVTILGIAPISGQAQGFVLFGVSPGTAGVTVTVDGDEKQVIPAQVTAQ